MPLPANPRFRPSTEADKTYLHDWAEKLLAEGPGMSEMGHRYRKALAAMSASERVTVLVALVLNSGQSMPFFPDQL